MNGPKVAAVLVTIVMAIGFGYISWTSLQAARAGSGELGEFTPANQVDKTMDEMESPRTYRR